MVKKASCRQVDAGGSQWHMCSRAAWERIREFPGDVCELLFLLINITTVLESFPE